MCQTKEAGVHQVTAEPGPVWSYVGCSHAPPPLPPKPLCPLALPKPLQAQFTSHLTERLTWMEHTKKICVQPNQ